MTIAAASLAEMLDDLACAATAIKVVADGLVRHAESSGEFRGANGFVAKFNKSIVRTICALLFPCRPTAIARLVVSVIVLPIQGVIVGRSLTHVSQEVLKPIAPAPSLADANASTVVARVGHLQSRSASLVHAIPETVERVVGFSMRCGRGDLATSATATATGPQRCPSHDTLSAASANAQPVCRIRRRNIRAINLAQHNPIPEFHSRQVFASHAAS